MGTPAINPITRATAVCATLLIALICVAIKNLLDPHLSEYLTYWSLVVVIACVGIYIPTQRAEGARRLLVVRHAHR